MRVLGRGLALLPVLAAFASACGSEAGPVVIGLVGPVSQDLGESMRLGAELAVNEINQRGGIGGRPLSILIRDDSADAEAAVRAAQDLLDTPGLVAVIGHLNSSATLAAAPIYNQSDNPVVAISPSASHPTISSAGPYTFRICPDDGVHGARLAVWISDELGARTVSVIYLNDDNGRGVRTTFVQSFTALGGTVVAEDPYVDELTTFEPYLSRALRQGASDGLMIAGTRSGAERVLLVLDSLGARPMVFGGDGLVGLEASGVVETDGTYVSSPYLPDQPGARNAAFVSAYREAYGNRLPDHRGAGAYDIVYLTARAVEAVGTDRHAIRDYLAGVGTDTPSFEGVTGTVAFDENGDVPGKEVIVGVIQNGRLVTAASQ